MDAGTLRHDPEDDAATIQTMLDRHPPSIQVEVLKKLLIVAYDRKMHDDHVRYTSGAA